MSKFAHLTTVKSARTEAFVYTPPASAFGATRILVGVDPGELSPVVIQVLRGLRRANPHARILVVGSTHKTVLLDDNMRAANRDDLLMVAYGSNRSAGAHDDTPLHHTMPSVTVTAPGYIAEYDCRITVTARAEAPPALCSLRGLLTPESANALVDLADLYFTIGYFFDGAVVAAASQVVWGDDLLAVDESVCRLANLPVPEVLNTIRAIRAS